MTLKISSRSQTKTRYWDILPRNLPPKFEKGWGQ